MLTMTSTNHLSLFAIKNNLCMLIKTINNMGLIKEDGTQWMELQPRF